MISINDPLKATKLHLLNLQGRNLSRETQISDTEAEECLARADDKVGVDDDAKVGVLDGE